MAYNNCELIQIINMVNGDLRRNNRAYRVAYVDATASFDLYSTDGSKVRSNIAKTEEELCCFLNGFMLALSLGE